jgi:3'-phosphoadenosine 5'-phosphosulfate synthase
MELLSFGKVYYDKRTHTMRDKDESRPDDFISISGSKMRALAKNGVLAEELLCTRLTVQLQAAPCTDPIPSDLIEANCVPQG